MFDQGDLAGRRVAAAPAGRVCGFGWLIKPWVIVVFCLLGLSPAVGQDQSGDYALGTGDILRVTVFGHEDLSREFEVDSGGRVTLPLIGDMPVVNRTPDHVEQLVVAALKPGYLKNPQVSVEVISYRPFYIIGEVANPGSYPYVGGMRIINAVAMAGASPTGRRSGTC